MDQSVVKIEGVSGQSEVDFQSKNDERDGRILRKEDDPALWRIKCRVGEEKEAALEIMWKTRMGLSLETRELFKIFSVIVPENIKGFIYVEANAISTLAFEGLRSTCYGLAGSRMVPYSEVYSVLGD